MRLIVGLLVAMVFLPAGPRLSRPGRRDLTGGRETLPPVLGSVVAALSRRRTGSGVAALPDLLELAARSRRAGLALVPSLVAASESVPEVELAPALARVAAGAGLASALDDWAESRAHPDADLVVAVLLLGDTSGAAVSARLDRTAATLRHRAALADEVRALTAQTRASATVVALAPIGFAAVVAATDGRFVDHAIGSPIGRLSVGAGLLLDALGVWWMRRLTRVAV